jgi:hypothetical protein
MKKVLLSVASLAAAITAVPATAATIFSENFDGLAGGNYGTAAHLNNFIVTNNDVDIVGVPMTQWGCPAPNGGAGNGCVDLNGNAPGTITSSTIALKAGTTYTISFSLAGNGEPQSPSPTSPYTMDVSFGGVTKSFSAAPLSPFATYSFDVTAAQAGTTSLIFASTSQNQPQFWGPILDDVKVTAPDPVGSAVPEPASWAMMLIGFGATGTALRNTRRRVRAVA